MKIVLYDADTHDVIQVIEGAEDVIRTDNGVQWQSGSLMGLKKPFILLPDETDVGETLTKDLVAGGVMQVKPSVEDQLRAENKALSDRTDFLEEVLTEMIFTIYQ